MECLRPLDDGPLLASTSEGPNAANATDSRPPPAHLAAPKRSSAAPIGARSEVAVVALMGDDLAFGHNVPNAFLASAPGHPFWIEVLMTVQAAAAARREGDWVEIVSGWGSAGRVIACVVIHMRGCRVSEMLQASGGRSRFTTHGPPHCRRATDCLPPCSSDHGAGRA